MSENDLNQTAQPEEGGSIEETVLASLEAEQQKMFGGGSASTESTAQIKKEPEVEKPKPVAQLSGMDVIEESPDISVADSFNNHPRIVRCREGSGTVQQDYRTTRPVTDEDRKNLTSVECPQYPQELLEEVDKALPVQYLDDKDPLVRNWMNTMAFGENMQAMAGQYLASLSREGSKWRQRLNIGDSNIGTMSVFRMRESRSDQDFALRVTSAVADGGGVFTVACWHSGFWLTLRRPTNSKLADLEYRFLSEKYAASRVTHGRALSNTTVFVQSIMLDFILEHLHVSNLENDESVRELLSINDLPVLAHAIASVCWPNGWINRRAVLGDAVDPYRIIEEVVEVGSMYWIDQSAFTDRQRAHMEDRRRVVTVDEVKRYQAEFQGNANTILTIKEHNGRDAGVKIRLRTPSANEYLTTGQRWLNDIVHNYEVDFAEISRRRDLTEREIRERDLRIHSKQTATILRLYDHYIDSIILVTDEGEEENTSKAARDTILEMLSSDAAIRNRFVDAVRDYIDRSAVVVIGQVVTDMTEEDKAKELPRFPYIIPIDVVHTFFTLLVRTMNIMRSLEH